MVRSTYRVQAAGGITVGDDLQRRVGAVRQVRPEHLRVERDVREAERAQPRQAEGWHEGDVEVAARVVAQAQEDLDGGLAVAHGQGDGEGALGQRQHGAVGGLGPAAAGELGHRVLDEAAARGVVELEVGGREGHEGGEGDERELHGDAGRGWLRWCTK